MLIASVIVLVVAAMVLTEQDKQISQQEIRDYELAPANMVQKPVAAAIERSEQNGLHELARDAG